MIIKNKKSNMETISINNDTILIQELNKTPKMFEYDYVFDEQSTQEDIYEEVSLLIQSMIHGNNICIMSYGQTCTGKTYTIQGNNNNKGIASRAVKEIFEIIDKHGLKLEEDDDDNNNQKTNIKNNPKNNNKNASKKFIIVNIFIERKRRVALVGH